MTAALLLLCVSLQPGWAAPAVPPGQDAAGWAEAWEHAGLDDGAAARVYIAPGATAWTVTVVGPTGAVVAFTTGAPRSQAEREDLAAMLASLLSTPALPPAVAPMPAGPPPAVAPPRALARHPVGPAAVVGTRPSPDVPAGTGSGGVDSAATPAAAALPSPSEGPPTTRAGPAPSPTSAAPVTLAGSVPASPDADGGPPTPAARSTGTGSPAPSPTGIPASPALPPPATASDSPVAAPVTPAGVAAAPAAAAPSPTPAAPSPTPAAPSAAAAAPSPTPAAPARPWARVELGSVAWPGRTVTPRGSAAIGLAWESWTVGIEAGGLLPAAIADVGPDRTQASVDAGVRLGWLRPAAGPGVELGASWEWERFYGEGDLVEVGSLPEVAGAARWRFPLGAATLSVGATGAYTLAATTVHVGEDATRLSPWRVGIVAGAGWSR